MGEMIRQEPQLKGKGRKPHCEELHRTELLREGYNLLMGQVQVYLTSGKNMCKGRNRNVL